MCVPMQRPEKSSDVHLYCSLSSSQRYFQTVVVILSSLLHTHRLAPEIKLSAFVSCRAQVKSLQEILKIISTHPADYLVYMTVSRRNRGTSSNRPCANTGSRRIHAGDWLSIWDMSIYPGSGNFDQYTPGCGGDTGKLDLSRQSFREERCPWWDQMMGGSEWTQRVCYIWGKCTTWECVWLKMGRSSMWRAEVRDGL